jgi:membrane-associated phospholipid phosphatase
MAPLSQPGSLKPALNPIDPRDASGYDRARFLLQGYPMTNFGRFLEILTTVVLIVGGYQFYFWAQRQTFRPARYLVTRWDSMIRFDPRWVWIYSGLYYPMILLAALTTPSWEAYIYCVGCFLTLLAIQVLIFITLPVAIPAEWRHQADAHDLWPRSMRMLDMVWSFDKLRNSMPSMHVSVATMVDLTIWSNWPAAGYVAGLFPLLIGISALKTKQHYVLDVVPGAIMGALVFFGWRWAVA